MIGFAFWFGDRVGIGWAELGCGIGDIWQMMRFSELPGFVLRDIIARPGALVLTGTPLTFALTFAGCAVVGSLQTWRRGLTSEREGEQFGSARWGTRRELAKYGSYRNPNPRNRAILTEHYSLALSRTGYSLRYDRNANKIIVGGSGSGKTRYYVINQIMQLNGSYFITDPKGTLLPSVGWMLVDAGYEVYTFDTNDYRNSMLYNPFEFIETDIDIITFVESFIMMTSDQTKTGGDDFWPKAEAMLYMACIALLRDYYPRKSYNFDGLLTLINLIKVDTEKAGEDALDLIFDQLRTGKMKKVDRDGARPKKGQGITGSTERIYYVKSPLRNRQTGRRPADCGGFRPEEDFALEQYLGFKSGAGKTLQSIVISAQSRLSRIKARQVRGIVSGNNEIPLDHLAETGRKVAIFATFDDGDKSLGFLHGILAYQALNRCKRIADHKYGGRLTHPVQFILDEYTSLHLPSTTADLISILRSRFISMDIILQSLSQMRMLYDEAVGESIKDCCDTVLFLGGKSESTNRAIAESAGKQTISVKSTSSTHGGQGSWSESIQAQARDLIDSAEVGKLDGERAILLIRGADPVIDRKYHPEWHPAYAQVMPGHRPVLRRRPLVGWEWDCDGEDVWHRHLKIQLPLLIEMARYRESFDIKRYREDRRRAAAARAREELRARARERRERAERADAGAEMPRRERISADELRAHLTFREGKVERPKDPFEREWMSDGMIGAAGGDE